MSSSTKLSTAVKALCFLAEAYPDPKSSSQISNRIGINASKIRQLLSMMSKSGLVKSSKGNTGGFVINKSPNNIHLQEIYCAVEDRKAFHMDVNRTDGELVNETHKFNNYFLDLFNQVQIEIEDKMTKINLDTVIAEIGINISEELKKLNK